MAAPPLERRPSRASMARSMDPAMRAEFNVLDKDGDGSLSEAELVALYRRGGMSEEAAAKEANSVMRHFDVNRDGRLQMEEFARWWEERQGSTSNEQGQNWLQLLAGNRNRAMNTRESAFEKYRRKRGKINIIKFQAETS